MKKTLLLLFCVISFLSASSRSAEQRIYASVFHSLYGNRSQILIWTDDKAKSSLFSSIENVNFIKNRKDADILLLFHTVGIITKKPIFVGSYLLLKYYKNEAIGGFYWQKGRPNLLFLRKNLQRKNLSLSDDLSKYIEDDF